jgi:hypothetical protein
MTPPRRPVADVAVHLEVLHQRLHGAHLHQLQRVLHPEPVLARVLADLVEGEISFFSCTNLTVPGTSLEARSLVEPVLIPADLGRVTLPQLRLGAWLQPASQHYMCALALIIPGNNGISQITGHRHSATDLRCLPLRTAHEQTWPE